MNMRRISLFSGLAAIAAAQTATSTMTPQFVSLVLAQSITITPQGAEVLRSLTGRRIPGVQVLHVTSCHELPQDFPATRLYQEASRRNFEPIAPELVPAILDHSLKRNWRKITIDLIRAGAGIGALFTVSGAVAASSGWKLGLLTGSQAGEVMSGFLRDRLPDRSWISRIADGQIHTAPGGCYSGLMLARWPGSGSKGSAR